MKISRLTINNFRGIKQATLNFEGHTLFLGRNNVGKSTICEALDLVLGPDRLTKFPPVEEFDFYNSEYLSADGFTAIPAQIEVVLTDLSFEIQNACPTHLEFWDTMDRKILESGEIDSVDAVHNEKCLRLETIAKYDLDEDEFEANTFFSHGTSNFDGSKERIAKNIKRLFGFLYLRTLRTGSRALSLERGSLLDIVLRLQGIRTGLWEDSLKRLRELEPPIGNEASALHPVLRNIEERLAQYIQLPKATDTTRLFVSQLTREHLRRTISFFLSTAADQKPVPFHEVGTGTLNTLVLALLSFIADVKKDNVIFAMEEPEIALAPHTQRRIANYLLTKTTQCFVTSHSPYVIERFDPDQIQILRRDGDATVTAISVGDSGLKNKMYRRHARRGLAEAMLAPAVIVAEGITEFSALSAVALKMEGANPDFHPLDLSGVTIFTGDGDGSLPVFGQFFKALGLKTYAFYDKKTRNPEETERLARVYDLPWETQYSGIEALLVTETPADRQWDFLNELRGSGELREADVPGQRPADGEISKICLACLKSNKGNGYAARLLEACKPEELPSSIAEFMRRVYADFPRPEAISLPEVDLGGDPVMSEDEMPSPSSL